MSNMKKILLFLILLCYGNALAYTETFYVCQGGDGSSPETSTCSTAWDADDFSSSGNWDTDVQNDGNIGPDDLIIFLVEGGTITGTSSAGVLIINGSGLDGFPITLQAEAGQTPVIDGENARECLVSFSDDYITVTGMRFTRGNRYGFEAYDGDNWIIEDCIADNSADDNFIFTGDNGVIRRCESYSASDNAIYLTGDDGSAADNWTVEYCYLHDNTSSGVQVNSESVTELNTSIVVRYNWIENNDNTGINELGSQGAHYYGNVIIGDNPSAAGIYIDHDGLGTIPDSIEVYNNTFYGDFNYGINIDSNTSGHIIKNNIFYVTSGYLIYISSGSSGSFSYNLYYRTGGYTNAWSVPGSTPDSLVQWEATAYAADEESGDPLFTTNGTDFTLGIGSPAISAGDDLGDSLLYGIDPNDNLVGNFGVSSDVTPIDFDLWGIANSWEMGAYGYGSSVPANAIQGVTISKLIIKE